MSLRSVFVRHVTALLICPQSTYKLAVAPNGIDSEGEEEGDANVGDLRAEGLESTVRLTLVIGEVGVC